MENDAPTPFPLERITETQRVFGKLYGREISMAEAIDMMTKVRAFAKLLMPLAAARIAERKLIQNPKPKITEGKNTLPVKGDIVHNAGEEPKACAADKPAPQPEKRLPL